MNKTELMIAWVCILAIVMVGLAMFFQTSFIPYKIVYIALPLAFIIVMGVETKYSIKGGSKRIVPLKRYKMQKIKYEDLRRIFRDFFNESYKSIDKKRFVPHAGKDSNCNLCKIERKAIRKLRQTIKNRRK